MKRVTARALENDIFNQEGIRVIFRVPATKRIAEYKYTKTFTERSSDKHTVRVLRNRVAGFLMDNTIEFVIITGKGEIATNGRNLGELRSSY